MQIPLTPVDSMSAAAAKTEAMTTEMQKLASNTDDGEPNADTVDSSLLFIIYMFCLYS